MFKRMVLALGALLGAYFLFISPGVAVIPDKPVFALQIEMVGRGGHVIFNGVPVFRNYGGLTTSIQVPVTEYVVNGPNNFGFELFDDNNKAPADAYVSATLVLRQNGTPKDQGSNVVSIAMTGAVAETLASGYPPEATIGGSAGRARFVRNEAKRMLVVTRPWTSTIRLPEWRWNHSELVVDNETTRTELRAAYQALWDALAAKQRDVLIRMLDEKASELALAYYISKDDAVKLIELADKPFEEGWTLKPLEWDKMKLATVGDGRLTSLRYQGGRTPINYTDDEHNRNSFDMWWRHEQGRWIIAR